MTPKQKAIELINSFYPILGGIEPKDWEYFCHDKAKKSALIAVDELIKYHDEFMDVVRYELPSNIVAIIPYKYWDEVKQEIEKL